MNQLLGRVIGDDQRDWDERLPFTMAAYRATPHHATGFSPNFLMFGHEVNSPIDLILGTPPDADLHTVDDFVLDKCHKIEQAHELARSQLKQAALRNKKGYDLKVRPLQYHVGQWVWFYCPRRRVGKDPKWQKLYSGPYLVTRLIGEVNLVLQKSSRSKPFVTHINKVKVCYSRTPESWLSQFDTHTEVVPLERAPDLIEVTSIAVVLKKPEGILCFSYLNY